MIAPRNNPERTCGNCCYFLQGSGCQREVKMIETSTRCSDENKFKYRGVNPTCSKDWCVKWQKVLDIV